MGVFEILVLAVVQGLTEFLPVSSKTHLLFATLLLGREPDLTLTIVMHAGSLLAILFYYWRSWLDLLHRRREIALLVVATLPAVVAALLFKDRLEALYASPRLGSALLFVTAAWLLAADRWGREKHALLETPLGKILGIGVAQACALLPGISRSGSTIGAGYLAGLKREDAVRFSFFMGGIAILGALALKAKDVVRAKVPVDPVTIGIGIAATFLVSWAAIKVVEKLSAKGRFSWFALYCALAGVAGLLCFK
ncbi:MAG TPA: undecaprenyl-diphosphate phosphatase [Planctomycetota bacterium]